jgi:hypothetical protein
MIERYTIKFGQAASKTELEKALNENDRTISASEVRKGEGTNRNS